MFRAQSWEIVMVTCRRNNIFIDGSVQKTGHRSMTCNEVFKGNVCFLVVLFVSEVDIVSLQILKLTHLKLTDCFFLLSSQRVFSY
jgi:hypothetical protein